MLLHPPCKINLGLRILRKRPDGYHDLESIFLPVPFLHDDLEIIPSSTSNTSSTSSSGLALTGSAHSSPKLGEVPVRAEECVNPVTFTLTGLALTGSAHSSPKLGEVPARAEECVNPVTFTLTGLALDSDPADNLCLKAYRLLKADFPDLPPVHIRLHKRIPFGAGLGGGSADAAFTLKGLNDLFALGLTVPQLEAYAARLGADCAFFIQCRPALAEGIGDKLTILDLNENQNENQNTTRASHSSPKLGEVPAGRRSVSNSQPKVVDRQWSHLLTLTSHLLTPSLLLLVKPPDAVSTREAYANLKIAPIPSPTSPTSATSPTSPTSLSTFVNDFESSVFPAHPGIAALKADLLALGAVYASMSGSGSTVYGFFPDRATLLAAAAHLSRTRPDCLLFHE